ncbi:DUF4280 domain-containing protein [Chondromyces crocatus]|uniref:DUF4280 domain-containing protein n=1 Tax=Chondromyces crocatus TaxID=52 RepID=A0A0K1EDT2_CHOCO|nr:DUF4280 domain-containing protein [Chondromyces crocatus]AKT38842.1 uncharacterized protein CMC5_029880 [Chondromyces crocatus]
MPCLVVHGARLRCSQGTSQATLTVLPSSEARGDEQPAATVMDHKPLLNVATFGMCQTQANPQVASATAAAQGVLTPMPCVPLVTAPWSPGASFVKVGQHAALTADSTCTCQWTGTVEVVDPGSVIEVE